MDAPNPPMSDGSGSISDFVVVYQFLLQEATTVMPPAGDEAGAVKVLAAAIERAFTVSGVALVKEFFPVGKA